MPLESDKRGSGAGKIEGTEGRGTTVGSEGQHAVPARQEQERNEGLWSKDQTLPPVVQPPPDGVQRQRSRDLWKSE